MVSYGMSYHPRASDAMRLAERAGDRRAMEDLYSGRIDPEYYIREHEYKNRMVRAPWDNPYEPMAVPEPEKPKKITPKFKANKKLLLAK